jgi:hypothetical protein
MFYEKKGSLQREFMAELYFIDWEAWYFFIESTFIGLTRSSPSILDNNKAPPENAFLTTKGLSLFGAHLL